jgi:hypothetical protein
MTWFMFIDCIFIMFTSIWCDCHKPRYSSLSKLFSVFSAHYFYWIFWLWMMDANSFAAIEIDYYPFLTIILSLEIFIFRNFELASIAIRRLITVARFNTTIMWLRLAKVCSHISMPMASVLILKCLLQSSHECHTRCKHTSKVSLTRYILQPPAPYVM